MVDPAACLKCGVEVRVNLPGAYHTVGFTSWAFAGSTNAAPLVGSPFSIRIVTSDVPGRRFRSRQKA